MTLPEAAVVSLLGFAVFGGLLLGIELLLRPIPTERIERWLGLDR